MTLSAKLKHKSAAVRYQAKREVEKLRELSLELRKATPWWVNDR